MKVIISEGQELTKGQKKMLSMFESYDLIVEPKKGWSYREIQELLDNLQEKRIPVVVASSNILLAKSLGFHSCSYIYNSDYDDDWMAKVLYQVEKENDNDWYLL